MKKNFSTTKLKKAFLLKDKNQKKNFAKLTSKVKSYRNMLSLPHANITLEEEEDAHLWKKREENFYENYSTFKESVVDFESGIGDNKEDFSGFKERNFSKKFTEKLDGDEWILNE